MNEVLLKQLRTIVGATNVMSSGDLSAYEKDWLCHLIVLVAKMRSHAPS